MRRRHTSRHGRAQLLGTLDRAIRTITAQSVLISQRIAARAGINSTDLECLDLLHFEGPATPRRLAELTGLTTGAVTMLVDRLERAGYVRRAPNPADRRSVLVDALPLGADTLRPLFEPLSRAMAKVNGRYSDADLAIVLDYLTRAHEAGAEHLRWLERLDAAPQNAARRGAMAGRSRGPAEEMTRNAPRRGK